MALIVNSLRKKQEMTGFNPSSSIATNTSVGGTVEQFSWIWQQLGFTITYETLPTNERLPKLKGRDLPPLPLLGFCRKIRYQQRNPTDNWGESVDYP